MPHKDRFAFFSSLRSPIRRIKKDIDRRFNITEYGFNNLYPQEMNQFMLRSPLVKASVNVLADFINGDGFERNNEIPVNDNGQTINDILEFASHDCAEYNGFALLLSMNGLGQPEEILNLPFEFVRFGLPDSLGRHFDVKVSNNWGELGNELPQGSLLEPMEFPLFNINTNAEEAIAGNAIVLYWTGGKNPNEYPLCSFDPVTNAAQADADIQQFELNSIANGFHGLTLFRYPGQFESDDERNELYNKIDEMTGVGGNGIFVIEVDEDTPAILENVPANNTDSLYLNTIAHIRDTITQNYALPSVLLGVTATGAVFNEQALIDAFVIYNTKTKNKRNSLARVFNLLGDFGEIIPQEIIQTGDITAEQESEQEADKEPEVIEEEPEETEAA